MSKYSDEHIIKRLQPVLKQFDAAEALREEAEESANAIYKELIGLVSIHTNVIATLREKFNQAVIRQYCKEHPCE